MREQFLRCGIDDPEHHFLPPQLTCGPLFQFTLISYLFIYNIIHTKPIFLVLWLLCSAHTWLFESYVPRNLGPAELK